MQYYIILPDVNGVELPVPLKSPLIIVSIMMINREFPDVAISMFHDIMICIANIYTLIQCSYV